MLDWGHWVNDTGIPDKEIDLNDYTGFVYIIRLDNGDIYIGKKQFWRQITRPPLKGYKRKRRDWVESDWRTYQSSSSTVIDRLSSSNNCIAEYSIIGVFSSKSALNLGETLATCLARVYSKSGDVLNVRLEPSGGRLTKTERDEQQFDHIVRGLVK